MTYMSSVSDCVQMDKVQDHALCYLVSDFNDTSCNLFQRASQSTLYLSWLRLLAIEMFIVSNGMSLLHMKCLFINKCIEYGL